ncbi:MAG: porin family protein, partial [Acidobacteria bacterium]|nr:porin family protein [Acidobacteriota bacterium]
LVTLLVPISGKAQADDSKFEVGVQLSMMGNRGGILIPDTAILGGGGRLTYNLNRYLAIEGELNYFPEAGYDRLRTFQGQFGIKSGVRFNRFGLFGKIRPGFQNIEYVYRVFCISPNVICPFPFEENDTGFSLDVGGVLEFYPTKRITVRFDAGDTIVTREERIFFINSVPPIFGSRVRNISNTLQLSSGIGIRF